MSVNHKLKRLISGALYESIFKKEPSEAVEILSAEEGHI